MVSKIIDQFSNYIYVYKKSLKCISIPCLLLFSFSRAMFVIIILVFTRQSTNEPPMRK